LNQKARDKEYAWRSLGFVTNFTKEDSRGKRMFLDSGHVAALDMFADSLSDEDEGDDAEEVDKAADYHAILSVLLESLKELIADGMITDISYMGRNFVQGL
jgi:hypothetical protein